MTRTLCAVVLFLGFTSIVGISQSRPELKLLMGTWKLNVQKSKLIGPSPISQTVTWKTTATGFDFTVDTVTAEGKSTRQRASGNAEGKPYAYTGTTATGITISGMRTTKWVDVFTGEEVDTVDGKVTSTRIGVISEDGKILTVRTKGVNPQGQPTSTLAVYEKQ